MNATLQSTISPGAGILPKIAFTAWRQGAITSKGDKMKLDDIHNLEQSRREFDRQVRAIVHEAIEEERDSITIHFEALADDTSSTGQYEGVTLHNLYAFNL